MGELPKKHYLDWDRPLLSLSTEWLISLSSERSLDLSDTLILLPTQQSGRRLLEALAVTMGKRGGGLLSPRMATPSILQPTTEPTEPNYGRAMEQTLVL